MNEPQRKPTLVCFGADPRWANLPITNLPEGTIKVRRRIRYTKSAEVFVKTATQIEHWILAPVDDVRLDRHTVLSTCQALKLVFLQGINVIP